VHLGHRVIIDRINEIARKEGGESVLLTFHPHPRSIVSEAGPIELLSTMEERLELLEKAGLQHVVVQPFTHEFSRISALEYVRDLLVNTIGVHTAVVGYDHHFGRNREGDIVLLKELAELYEFNVVEIDAQMIKEVKVSSTKVRRALKAGEVTKVSNFLGYNYRITGTVIKGDGRGHSLGFPTANLVPDDADKLIPGPGVYAVNVHVNGSKYQGMLNIGKRPTFKSGEELLLTLEVHLLDFEGDLYGQQITLEFKEWIRSEKKFANSRELIEQLQKDRLRTKEILN
jgi:riboflavin kinase/FMN adenylyltransferase